MSRLYLISRGTNWICICYVEESRTLLWSSGQSSFLKIGDVLCLLWSTNWIYILVCYVEESRPPLWSSGQSSWLHNGDVLCFLWGANWSYVCYVEESRPPLWFSGQSYWLHNWDVLCFLWGANWSYVCYVEESRPPLWFSGQSSWLQIQRSLFDSRRYQIFWEVVGLERGSLSLVSTTEELLERKSSGSRLENRDYDRRDSPRTPRDTPLSVKVGTNFAVKWRSLGRYSSFEDSLSLSRGPYFVYCKRWLCPDAVILQGKTEICGHLFVLREKFICNIQFNGCKLAWQFITSFCWRVARRAFYK
jgi:hypothetical protein